MGCTFCRIVRGEIPCMKIYEDADTMVIMDVAGDVDGHMLAIPKNHVESVLDCDENTLARFMNTVGKVSRMLTEKCGYDGVNLLNASGRAAGQSVPHFHIHIIPRKAGDGVDAWPRFPGAAHDVSYIYEKIKREVDT